jgi:Flp pilus assembly protein TadD
MSADNDGNGNVRAIELREAFILWGKRVACLALVALVAFGAFRGYGVWRKHHLTRQVASFVARGDFANAVLVARRLLALDPQNLAASEAMAEMAEASNRADAIEWRRQLAQLQPNSTDRQLQFVRTALRFGQVELASRLLDAQPDAVRNTVAFRELAGAAALARGDAAAAESHFVAALEIEPEKPQLALNLAVIRLTTPDQQLTSAARTTLARLTQQPEVRTEALRALASEALARRDAETARRWTTQLCANVSVTLADLLLHYEAVSGTDAAAAALDAIKTKAAATAAHAAEFITWLNRRGMAAVAAEWAATLPPHVAEVQPVPLAIAETFSFREDWAGLRALVQEKNWGSHEALRLAVESHALQRLSGSDTGSMQAQNTWRAALKAADRQQLVAMAQLAEGWGYHAQAEETWWAIANKQDNARTALGALQRIYKQRQDSRGLLRVAKRALELNPGDLIAANNCASLGLLLNADNSSRRLAAKLHHEHPQNRAFTATYAYALHTEGKTAEALHLLESLEQEVLQHPTVAAYYFVLLIASENLERARLFLPHAKRATLLPEEQELLAAATRKLVAVETATTPKTAAD